MRTKYKPSPIIFDSGATVKLNDMGVAHHPDLKDLIGAVYKAHPDPSAFGRKLWIFFPDSIVDKKYCAGIGPGLYEINDPLASACHLIWEDWLIPWEGTENV